MTAKAKITREYRCAPQGHTVETFKVGTIVTGQVAEWALADKAASRMIEKRGRPRKKPLETQAETAPPENKDDD